MSPISPHTVEYQPAPGMGSDTHSDISWVATRQMRSSCATAAMPGSAATDASSMGAMAP
jgi:hypothetical protein